MFLSFFLSLPSFERMMDEISFSAESSKGEELFILLSCRPSTSLCVSVTNTQQQQQQQKIESNIARNTTSICDGSWWIIVTIALLIRKSPSFPLFPFLPSFLAINCYIYIYVYINVNYFSFQLSTLVKRRRRVTWLRCSRNRMTRTIRWY